MTVVLQQGGNGFGLGLVEGGVRQQPGPVLGNQIGDRYVRGLVGVG
ncbi:hypothetical protein ACWC3X_37630 [Streptomyces populi]